MVGAKASVIILTYTHPQNLKAAVAALKGQDCEIIIADDGLGFFHPEDFATPVKVYTHERTVPRRAATRNGGARLATTDNLIFLDDDVLPSPWLVDEHCKALADFDASIGSLTTIGWKLSTDMRFKQWGYNPVHLERRNMFWTGNLGVRREAFEEVGGFDERYGGEYGYEDADLGEALRRKFKAIYWNPEAMARNLDPMGQWGHSEGERNRKLFFDKWSDPFCYPNEKVLVTLPGFSHASLEWAEGFADALQRRGFDVDIFDFNKLLSFLDDGMRADLEDRTQSIFMLVSEQMASAVVRCEPDWVLVVEGTRFHKGGWEVLQKMDVKVGVILTESPYRDPQQTKFAPYADVLFCNEKQSVGLYKDGIYLPASYNRMRHRLRRVIGPNGCDVLAAMNPSEDRQTYLEGIDWSGIDMHLIGAWKYPYGHYLFVSQIIKEVHNAALARAYNSAKIGLNVYRGRMDGESLNPRAYEMAACGCFQISTPRAENDIFGGAVIEAATPATMERKIRHYLEYGQERAGLVDEARKAVANCSFDDRVEILIDAMRR